MTNHVSDDYFRTFGIQLLAGRGFTPQDRSAAVRVALVNEATARAYFAGRSPLGETLRFGDSGINRIIGIVRDAKHLSVREQATRFAFLPLWQPLNGIGRVTLAIASDVPTSPLVRAVTREIHGIQSSALISDIVSVRDQIDATLVSERLLSTLATAFAALALGLAAIGLYGVLSFSVARRRAEFGIRIALGSPPARVAWNVIRGVLLQVGVGIAIGLPAALAAARAAGGLLFGVTPTAADVYIVSAGVLIAIAGVAAWMPAWRACSIDPSEVLRCE